MRQITCTRYFLRVCTEKNKQEYEIDEREREWGRANNEVNCYPCHYSRFFFAHSLANWYMCVHKEEGKFLIKLANKCPLASGFYPFIALLPTQDEIGDESKLFLLNRSRIEKIRLWQLLIVFSQLFTLFLVN